MSGEYDRPTRTHRVVVTFEMEEMNGTPEESAEVLLDLYVADEVTVASVVAYDPRLVAHGGDEATEVFARVTKVANGWIHDGPMEVA
jgi:hypothetical protein